MAGMLYRHGSIMRQQAVMFVLMGAMVVIHALQYLVSPELELHFMTVPSDVTTSWESLRSGQFDGNALWPFITLLTSTFMHGYVGHLTGNLIFYWIFGALINELIGWRWLLALVVITGIGGSIIHVVMNTESIRPTLGASGVVSGFAGAYLGLAVRWQLPDPHVWPIARPVPPFNLALLAAAFVAMDYYWIFGGGDGKTAFGAHVGGFTTGLFLTSFIIPRPAQALSRR